MHPQEVARHRVASWGCFRFEGAAMLGMGSRTRDTAGRRRSRSRASLWMGTPKSEAMESMTGCRWLSASIRTCRKSHFGLMGAMFHLARSM